MRTQLAAVLLCSRRAGAKMSGQIREQLRGRSGECNALEELASKGEAGQSSAPTLRGEAGIGKSALLDHLAQHVAGYRVLARLTRATEAAATDWAWVFRHGRRLFSATRAQPKSSTERLLSDSDVRVSKRIWHGHTYSTASGCDGRTAATMPVSNFVRGTPSSVDSAPTRSPNVPSASCGPPARP